ncbi:MAG TPA: hypothetical protein IAA09_12475 [Candidatus Lachnoclostridium avicola]|nr:hypothetical protein [Candidatus Lachnoclostridium avicola]
MRRDWEEVNIYAGGQTVQQVFSEDVPMGSINPKTGHEIIFKIVRQGKTLCSDYGKLPFVEHQFDGMPVKKVVRWQDEIRIYV